MVDTRMDAAAADDRKDARSKRNDDASERQEKRERKDDAKREESERKQKRKHAEREKAEKEIEKRQDRREERKKDDKSDDAEKRQKEREKERKKDDKSDDDAEKRQKEREEMREEIQRKVESKKREIEERQEGREKDCKGDEKDSDDDAEKRQKEREKTRAAGERDAEDKKEEIEKAKKERDHQLDTLERRSEAKKREIEQLKEEARNIHKHDRESADLGEAIKEAVFFTYSDHITGGMCASGETAAMNDIDLQILGARGAKDPFAYPDVKNVKTKKVFAFLHALTNEVWRKKFGIGDDTIVSVGDATDVLYFKHRSEVIRAFEDIETESKVADNKLVVVSSERNCWPWMIHGKERLPNGTAICASFPDAPSSYKYLNSGSLMGRAKGLAELLRDIVDRMQSVNEDDQMILANAFLRQSTSKTSSDTPYVIALDYMQRLFQTAYDGQLESRNFAQYRAKDAYYDRAHTQVVNTETHTTPVIVHFNGLKANLFPITRHFLVHHGHAEHYAQIKQSWLQTNPFFNASCQHIVDNIKIGIMPPMQKPTHTITPDVERKRLEEER
jgi:chemotaxis protein histidine kinase CheA